MLRAASLLALTLSLNTCGDDLGTGPDLPRADTREGRWERDLTQLASELEARHANLYARVSRERFASEVAALRADIPSLEDAGVVVGMMRLVALVGDAHTTLGWQSHREFQRAPLRLEWFSDGVYVVAASEEIHRALGARVLGVGMVTINTALDRLRELVPHENDAWFRFSAPPLLVVPAILREQVILPDASVLELELASPGGEAFAVAVTAPESGALVEVETARVPLYRQRPEDNYWFTFLEDSQTLYAQYRRASAMPGESVASFSSRLLTFLDANPVRAVVIDLRHNTGGNSSLLEPLIRGLEARPDWSGGEGLYVVIGRATFSSGLLNAYSLQERTRAILVGEPTGGKPNHFGEVRAFTLSHSRLEVRYSLRFFEIIPDRDPPSLVPDVRVEVSFQDFLEGRDPVLTTILSFVGS